jgi:hypothetical protein
VARQSGFEKAATVQGRRRYKQAEEKRQRQNENDVFAA